ncbi:MAG: hypothetical protein KR126chlam6_00693 [Candidatus Anoxychlamydiales bacterium]|nr:hypothetical protein [Candidatus Anoxychlamydiales bacterium]
MASAPGSPKLPAPAFLADIQKSKKALEPPKSSTNASPFLPYRVIRYIPKHITKTSLIGAMTILSSAIAIQRKEFTWLIAPAIALTAVVAKKVVDCCKSNQTKRQTAQTQAFVTSADRPAAVGAPQSEKRARIQSMLDKQNAQAISALTQMLLNPTLKRVGGAIWKMLGGQMYAKALSEKKAETGSENTAITVKDIIKYDLLDRRIEHLQSLSFEKTSHLKTEKNLEEAIELIKRTSTETGSSIGAILHLFSFAYVIHFNPETNIFTLQDPKGDAAETFDTENKLIDRLIAVQKNYSYRKTCEGNPLLLKIFINKADKPQGAEAKKEIS